MRQTRSAEEIWLEVQRVARELDGADVLVPLPSPCPETKSGTNWTMSLAHDRTGVLEKATEKVQANWNLRLAHAVRRALPVEKLHAVLMERISALPRIAARMPVLNISDIVWIADALPGESTWAVLGVTAKRSCRADVAAVIWAAQREFDLATE